MGIPPPNMAKQETLLFRAIKQFHKKFIDGLGVDPHVTLRCAAWQLDAYIEENKKYKDAEYLKILLKTMEAVIQQQCHSKWSVARAKKSLCGRTSGVNQYAVKMGRKKSAPIPAELKRAIQNRVAPSKE